MSTTPPSNHESTGYKLADRIRFDFTTTTTQPEPRPFDSVWKEFAKECEIESSSDWYQPDLARDCLKSVFSAKRKNETEFDNLLFGALKTCLDDVVDPSYTTTDCIVLKSDNNDGVQRQYARGFARQVTRRMLEFPKNYGYEIKEGSRYDHSCVLFEIDEECNARTIHVTSLVELKTEDTNCQMFNLTTAGTITEPTLADEHGALAQVLMYNAGDVIPCRARLGLLENTIPVFVLACRLQSPKKKPQQLHWVLATLNIPEKCGFWLLYSVKDFGQFPTSESKTEEQAMLKAMSGYLEVLLFGLKGAKDVLRKMKDQTLQSTILCGRKLFFGGYELKSCSLIASPIPGAVLRVDPDSAKFFKVSQGEIFTGVVDLSSLRESTRNDPACIWFNKSGRGNTSVVVKCSSKSFHHWLFNSRDTEIALKDVYYELKVVALALSEVLLGVHFCAAGLVIIMKNLKAHSYVALKADGDIPIVQLWTSFRELVESTLIPLADRNIVHGDIRTGFDYCANLLYNITTKHVQLIDFESLVMFHNLKMDLSQSMNAYKFVGWQCLRVAFAWITETTISNMPKEANFQEFFLKGCTRDPDNQSNYSNFQTTFGNSWESIISFAKNKAPTVMELNDILKHITAGVYTHTSGTAQ